MRTRGGCFTLLLLLVVLGGFSAMVWSNAQSIVTPGRFVIPQDVTPTDSGQTWQEILRSGYGGSPVPTIPIPGEAYVPPTAVISGAATITPVSAASVSSGGAALFSVPVTITPPPPTPTVPVGTQITVRDVTRVLSRPTSLPALIPPLAIDPRDHYWFIRPIDSFHVNAVRYYHYGTNGPRDAALAIHHGVDLPNEVGTEIRAAEAGTVVFATSVNPDGSDTIYKNQPAYGRVVVIEHDFGYRGEQLYTLYAHMFQALVSTGDRVERGQAIGLVGDTGHASGGHVHFEVMLGIDSYNTSYNPVLWMVPYVGHGVLVGRVVDSRGEFLQDVDVTLAQGGLVRDSTTTYVFRDVGSRVNPDPLWQENFAFPDVPAGTYSVSVTLNGIRESQTVTVREGMSRLV